MVTLEEILTALEQLGTEQTRKTFRRHGAPEAMFGVKVQDLKPLAKKIKGNQTLASELYRTLNSDAMYLAGLVADGSRMTKRELQQWARDATWQMISEYTVPWVTVESPHSRELALRWIDARQASIASSGWATYAGMVSMYDDADLDLDEIQGLLDRVQGEIEHAPNRVRYTMNGFVIAVGCYVAPLTKRAKEVAASIGKVEVDMGETACKVPDAGDSIRKVEGMGRVGKKRKTLKC